MLSRSGFALRLPLSTLVLISAPPRGTPNQACNACDAGRMCLDRLLADFVSCLIMPRGFPFPEI